MFIDVKSILEVTKTRNLYDIHLLPKSQHLEIAKNISYLLTNTYALSDALVNSLFELGYDFEVELDKLVIEFYNTHEREVKISNIHYLYQFYLERCCDYNSLKDFLDNENFDTNSLKLELIECIEKKANDWKNCYYKKDYSFDYKTIVLVNYYYITLLNYLPNENDLKFLFTIKEQGNLDEFKSKLLTFIYSKSDYIYLQECRSHFNNLGSLIHPSDTKISDDNLTNSQGLKIKYYGAVGTSGYATITKSLIKSLVEDERFDIYFSVLQFQNYNEEDNNALLSSLSKKQYHKYDYIIIHSTPEYFPILANIERKINPNVIIYAITVWETELLPLNWDFYCSFVDKISVPSQFSSLAFKNFNCDVIHHPFFIETTGKECKCLLFDIKEKYKYIYYSINEWTNRKGIDDLIDVFLDLYGCNNKILLYIKTFGDISKEEGTKFILELCKTKSITFLGNIILDYTRVSSSYINCIHSCADCYVSFTRSEGQGLGICYSALQGNQLIVTKYSGHLDYLSSFSNVSYVNYNLIPATFCTTWSKKHSKCKLLPYCQYFDKFNPSIQVWADVDKEHAKELMLQQKPKIKKNISPFTSSTFCNELYTSLITSVKTCNKSNKSFTDKTFPQYMYLKWNFKKKKIGILNCSGYGNVGDFSYSFIFENFFKNKTDYELIFIDEQNYDLRYVIEIDFLIIGGGGLLNVGRLNDTNTIFIYTNYCIFNKIPYYIISVGFQDCDFNCDGKKFQKYSLLLDNSEFISVRSIQDYIIASSIVKPQTKDFIYVYNDLVYSMYKFIPFIEYDRNILLVVLDENWINIHSDFIRNDIQQKLLLNNELILVFTTFAGHIFNIREDVVKKYFPKSIIIQGLENKYSPNRSSSLSDIISLLCKTKIIISGRFHSNILAKVYKVPIIENYSYVNYKLEADKFSNLNNDNTLTPLNLVYRFIKNEIKYNSKYWNENDRNNAIVSLHQKTNIDISIIQNWSNRQIEDKLN
jgi:hypothetical protein